MWGISSGTLGCMSDMEKKFWKREGRGNLDDTMGEEDSYGGQKFLKGCSDLGGHDQIFLNGNSKTQTINQRENFH